MYCVIWSCGTVSTTTVAGDDLDTTVVKARCQPRNPSDVLDGRLNKVFDVLDADYFTALSDLVKRTVYVSILQLLNRNNTAVKN